MASAAIDATNVRELPPHGMAPALLAVIDNADFHLLGSVLSVIPVGDILLGYEKVHDIKHFDEHFLPELPLPTVEMAAQIVPTEEDDAEAIVAMRYQNLLALLNAIHLNVNSQNVMEWPEENALEWSMDDMVLFHHRHVKQVGKITEIDGDQLRVYYREENGNNEYVLIPSGAASPPPETAPSKGNSLQHP